MDDLIHNLAVVLMNVRYLPLDQRSPSLQYAQAQISAQLESVPLPYAGSALEDIEMRLRDILVPASTSEEDPDPAEVPYPGKPRRARCLYCGKSRPVTSKGVIRKHWVIGGPTTTHPGQRVVCGGSGRTPV